MISSASYYSEYHGHKLRHLEAIYPLLRDGSDALLWTAGDSSLDNKCVSICFVYPSPLSLFKRASFPPPPVS